MRHYTWILLGAAACGGTTAGGGAIDGSVAEGGTLDGATPPDAGDGGKVGDGSVTCAQGTASFALHAIGDFCVSYCDGWLRIVDPNGAPVTLDYCGLNCDTCETRGCAGACAAPMTVPDGGVTETWNGTEYDRSDTVTCGGATQCFKGGCATPGKYVARMCLYKNVGDGGVGFGCPAAQTPTCTDVPFDWPATGGTVSGTIGP